MRDNDQHEEAARWMVEEFNRESLLDQKHAVGEIARIFGPRLTYLKPSGARAIDQKVLYRFKALTRDTAVWSRSQRHWRRRSSHDQPGRACP
jgi:hypothetical protein